MLMRPIRSHKWIAKHQYCTSKRIVVSVKFLKLDSNCLWKHENLAMDVEEDEKRMTFKDAQLHTPNEITFIWAMISKSFMASKNAVKVKLILNFLSVNLYSINESCRYLHEEFATDAR